MTQETTKLPLLTSWVSLLLMCFLSVREAQFLRLCWLSREIRSLYLHSASISLYVVFVSAQSFVCVVAQKQNLFITFRSFV